MIKKMILGLMATLFAANPVFAEYPKSWEWNFQPPASTQAEQLHEFHNLLLWITGFIVVFVLVLLLWVAWRYNHKSNPVPSKTTHNTLIEVVWTIIPVMILIVIAIPSFRILFYQGRIPDTDLTIKTIGYQWHWGYEYPDQGGISFLSFMIPDDEIDASKGQKRLLETDTSVMVPVNKSVRLQVTAADVIHSWAMPAFGVKKDAIPGRLNETWFKADKIGTYYGQCSEICGTGHSYMPIRLEVVSQEDFDSWVAKMQKEQGIEPPVVEAIVEEAVILTVEPEAEPATTQNNQDANTQNTEVK